MSQPFSLLGVDGLLLPGTKERPCPWQWFNQIDLVLDLKCMAEGRPLGAFAEKAATAACWWRAEFQSPEDNSPVVQSILWQRVFEAACERMAHETK